MEQGIVEVTGRETATLKVEFFQVMNDRVSVVYIHKDSPTGDDDTVGEGYAIRNESDENNPEVGFAIAYARAAESFARNVRRTAHAIRHEAGC